jgi:hypothetical protein
MEKRYKAACDFNIQIGLLKKTITNENFTDEDVEFLFAKWPNKFNHNFKLVDQAEEPIEVAEPIKEVISVDFSSYSDEDLKEYAKEKNINLGRSKSREAILKRINAE